MADNASHTVEIQTARLVLRKFRATDAEAMYRNWAHDAEVTQHLTWLPHANLEVTQAMIDKWVGGYSFPTFYQWAIDLDGEVIGSIGCAQPDTNLNAIRLGYALGRDYWGNGYMTEALTAVLRHLFSLGYNRVEANHYIENPASGRVMEKAGMQYEGLIRDGGKDGTGRLRDVKQYAILQRDLLN